MKLQFLLILNFLYFFSSAQDTIHFNNPSFEEPTPHFTIPEGWKEHPHAYHSPIEIHYNYDNKFNVSEGAKDSVQFLSMVARSDGSTESFYQVLNKGLTAGNRYQFSFYAMKSTSMESPVTDSTSLIRAKSLMDRAKALRKNPKILHKPNVKVRTRAEHTLQKALRRKLKSQSKRKAKHEKIVEAPYDGTLVLEVYISETEKQKDFIKINSFKIDNIEDWNQYLIDMIVPINVKCILFKVKHINTKEKGFYNGNVLIDHFSPIVEVLK